jgi:acetyl esterase/lipase
MNLATRTGYDTIMCMKNYKYLFVSLLVLVGLSGYLIYFTKADSAEVCTTNTKLPASTLTNVLYGANTTQNLLDIYPASTHPCRFIILVHGGGFTFGAKKEGDFTSVAQWLSSTLGYPAVNIEYRDSLPGYPTQVQDILTAMKFVETNYGAKEFILFGHSSGAYLTMLTTLAKNNPPASFSTTYPVSPIIGAIGTSGSYDYNLLTIGQSGYLNYAGAFPNEANVITHADSSDVPVLLISGDQDIESPWQSAEALHNALPNSQYNLLAGACHNCVLKPFDPINGITALTAGYISNYLAGLAGGGTPPPPPTKFIVGDRVVATTSTSVRSTPAGTIVGSQNTGFMGTITSGPTSATLKRIMYTWWSVNFDTGADGWVIESSIDKASSVKKTS